MMSNPKKGRAGKTGIFKSVGKSLREVVLTLVLVIIFFGGFLALLEIIFPTGISIKELIGSKIALSAADHPSTPEIHLAGGAGGEVKGAAVLERQRNRVKSRNSNSISWQPARPGMTLHSSDAVQTLNESGARIVFDQDNYLDMGSNSLIIIRSIENYTLFEEQRSFLVMFKGDLRGKILTQNDKSTRVEIATPSGVARIHSGETPGEAAEFKISVHSDQSSTITIFQGSAEIISEGKSIVVEANQGINLVPGQSMLKTAPLPAMPNPLLPLDGSLSHYRYMPPSLRFAWSSPDPDIDGYRFVLASDPDCKNLILEEVVEQPEFTHGNLKADTYYWQVSSLLAGLEGKASHPRKLELRQDLEPPHLAILSLPTIINNDTLTLTGKTEQGTQVFIDGTPVQVMPNGDFNCQIPLNQGPNSLVVEAVDAAGNTSYQSHLVYRKP